MRKVGPVERHAGIVQATHPGQEIERERERETRVSWLVTCTEEPVPAFAPEAASWVPGVDWSGFNYRSAKGKCHHADSKGVQML